MPVGDFRSVRLDRAGGHRAFDDSAGGVDVVHDVEGRWVLHHRENHHQVEHVLRVVEVPCPRILNLHNDRVQFRQRLSVKRDMVRSRSQLRPHRAEHCLQVPSLREQIVHIPSVRRVPAVLGAEAPDPPVQQRLVQLILQSRRPKRKHN